LDDTENRTIGLGSQQGSIAANNVGIIIGVGAVIATVSLGQGARQQVQQEIASMGTDTLSVRAGSSRSWGIRGGSGTTNTLTFRILKPSYWNVRQFAL
jgi:ABC-type antimicrobial peptide transport system permease subunit